MNPLVSVVVTTYNQAPYITEAIRSVLSQRYDRYEVIVVDDGSTDGTPQRIASFGKDVIYIRQRNQGIAASRNTGISHANGEFIALLDGDDVWEPDKLAVQVAAAQAYPQSGMIVVDGVQFSGAQLIQSSLLGKFATEVLPSDKPTVPVRCYSYLLKTNPIHTVSQVMFPTAVLRSVGLSDPRIRLASDYDLYLRIAAKYDVTFIRKPLTRWRYLPTSASGPLALRGLRYNEDWIEVLKKQCATGPSEYRTEIARVLSEEIYAACRRAYDYGRNVDRFWATRHLLRLWMANTTAIIIAVFLIGLWLPPHVIRSLKPAVRKMPAVRKVLGTPGS